MAANSKLSLYSDEHKKMWEYMLKLAICRLKPMSGETLLHDNLKLIEVNGHKNKSKFLINAGSHVAYLTHYLGFKQLQDDELEDGLALVCLEHYRAFLGSVVFSILDNQAEIPFEDGNPRKLLSDFLLAFCKYYYKDPFKYITKKMSERIAEFDLLVPSLSSSRKEKEWNTEELIITWDYYYYTPFKQKLAATVVLSPNVVLMHDEIKRFKKLQINHRYIWEMMLEYNIYPSIYSFMSNFNQLRRTWYLRLKDLEPNRSLLTPDHVNIAAG